MNFPHIWSFTRFGREVVAHEGVEMRCIRILAKGLFHGPPVAFVQRCLQPGLQPRKDEVVDQVGLTQFQPGGVHALKNQLQVVLQAVQGHVNDDQLGQALADGLQLTLVLLDT